MIINAIRWGAWYYTIVLIVCQTYKWSGTFIIKDGRYTLSFSSFIPSYFYSNSKRSSFDKTSCTSPSACSRATNITSFIMFRQLIWYTFSSVTDPQKWCTFWGHELTPQSLYTCFANLFHASAIITVAFLMASALHRSLTFILLFSVSLTSLLNIFLHGTPWNTTLFGLP
jgi:hypothetical protein